MGSQSMTRAQLFSVLARRGCTVDKKGNVFCGGVLLDIPDEGKGGIPPGRVAAIQRRVNELRSRAPSPTG
jgi:hypothetical protein